MPLPPLAALFLAHFDDIRGQSVVYYVSTDAQTYPSDTIEHACLPSGLHSLAADLVLFTHHDLPGIGLFRSRDTSGSSAASSGKKSRGRRMATLGVVLPPPGKVEDLFSLRSRLEEIYDTLEVGLGDGVFDKEAVGKLLDEVWAESGEKTLGSPRDTKVTEAALRRLIKTLRGIPQSHPVAYLPALVSALGPSIVTMYKYALAGRRILLYSPPPLLPLAAFAWCISAMSLPPSLSSSDIPCKWLGNVGLMDLAEMKVREGGWVATTSDAIYRSHPDAYDLFVDLSTTEPTLLSSISVASPTPRRSAEPKPISYSLADLPLYRTLLPPSASPSTTFTPARQALSASTSSTVSNTDHFAVPVSSVKQIKGSWWLMFYDVVDKVWTICVGVCEYAVGMGKVGEGDIRLERGEEDAPILSAEDDQIADEVIQNQAEAQAQDVPEQTAADGATAYTAEHDDAIKEGRRVLASLHHNSYHLYAQIRAVRGARASTSPLTDAEVKILMGRWRWGKEEARWWGDLARVWDLTE